jgi:hypothetical protein
VILLFIAVAIPEPTAFQGFVFRVVLSIAAAGVGAALPGFLDVNLPLWKKASIRATGALALFVIVFNINPPKLISEANAKSAVSTNAPVTIKRNQDR